LLESVRSGEDNEQNFKEAANWYESEISFLKEYLKELLPKFTRDYSEDTSIYYATNKTLAILELKTNNVTQVQHKSKTVQTYHSNTVLTSDERFFVTGADDPSCYRQTLELNFAVKSFFKKASITQGRSAHSFTEVRQGLLIITGGWNITDKYLQSCEVYSTSKDEWVTIASMNKERWHHTAFVFSLNTVYVFGGSSDNSIERLTLSNTLEGSWTTMTIDFNSVAFPWEYVTHLIINDTEIMVFGGKDNFGNATKDCVIFNREKCTVRKMPYKLIQDDIFYRNMHGYDENSDKHFFLSMSGNMHKFDGLKWEYKE